MFNNLNRKWLWILDAVLFIGFLLSFWLDFTGLELHQWLGVLLAFVISYHLMTHLGWLEAVLKRFFQHTSNRARLNLTVDLLILVSMTVILVSGVAITTWFVLPWEPSPVLAYLHIIASIVALALLVLKIGLHWRWIVHTLQTALLPQLRLPRKTPTLQTASIRASAGRRDFLVLMGITSAAALLSILKPVQTLGNQSTLASTAVKPISPADGAPAPSSPSSASADLGSPASSQNPSDCWKRCAQSCEYPGNCRGYQDMDGNGLCDFGECV